jgi:hypothetical protein
MDDHDMDDHDMDDHDMDDHDMDDHDMDDRGHMEMGHMSMTGPGGYPLAEGAEDRDGLEMDVLHRRIGPVLPCWPAGLVVEVTLAGDTITDASASLVDAANRVRAEELRNVPALALDRAAQVLLLAGWGSMAARALRVRDLVAAGEADRARRRLEPLHRRIERSVVLRWSLRGLQIRLGVDVRTVLLARLERARAELSGRQTAPEPVTPLEEIPALVNGRDLSSARLIVAALTIASPDEAADTTAPAIPMNRPHHA